MQKVCLSPQRRSFGSGCSWKDMSSSSAASTTPTSSNQSGFLAENRDSPFFEMEGPRPPQGKQEHHTWLSSCIPSHGLGTRLLNWWHLHHAPSLCVGPRPPPTPSFSPGPPYQGPPTPSSRMPPPHPLLPHTPRVINHVPLRDRERDNKRNWREKDGNWRNRGQRAGVRNH